MRHDLPTGTVTFCFTDVEGSTRLLHELGAEAYAEALAEHRALIREACISEGGVEVDTQGDAFFFAFAGARAALAAASSFTDALAATPIRVRCGLHTGTPLLAEEGYVGHDVHLAARVASAGHGGQVLVSSSTAELLSASGSEPQALLASGGARASAGAADRGSEPQALPLVLLGWHRLKDVSEPIRLYQLGEGSFPPLRTIANSNLPTPASSFLGRERELYEADQLLRSTRLLTISGPGGQGKTRFALELARRAREERFSDYPDGIFGCFFSSLRDPGLVLATLCQSLSLREQPGQGALEALSSHLEGKRMLLLCDNLEHLLAAAPELSQLLERAAGLTLLVTSREVLRIFGETSYSLPPLPEDESVALVCERARTEPTPEIGELARRLEGLPLALELAAARLSLLTPKQLLERLSQRLDLLKASRDGDPRQQTLRATIEWSYDLLSPGEQALFRSLSVFAGGGTLEAAEEVCGADLDSLQSLVDKSLLRFTGERFWMLETIREFALERLNESVEADVVCASHAHHFLALAEGAESVDELEAEHDNVRAAFRRLCTEDDRGHCARLAIALMPLWRSHGPISEGREWFAATLALPGQLDDAVRSPVLVNAAWLATLDADPDAAEQLLEESLTWQKTHEEASLRASRLGAWARVAVDRGDFPRAREFWERTLAVNEAAGDRAGVARTLNNLGHVAFWMGDTAGAADLMDQALALVRQTSDKASTAQILESRAEVALAQGTPSLARTCLVECHHLHQEIGERFRNCEVLLGLAEVVAAEGNVLEAARMLGAEETLRQEVRRTLTPSERVRLERVVADLRTDVCSDAFDAAWTDGAAVDVDALLWGRLGPVG